MKILEDTLGAPALEIHYLPSSLDWEILFKLSIDIIDRIGPQKLNKLEFNSFVRILVKRYDEWFKRQEISTELPNFIINSQKGVNRITGVKLLSPKQIEDLLRFNFDLEIDQKPLLEESIPEATTLKQRDASFFKDETCSSFIVFSPTANFRVNSQESIDYS